MSEVYAIFLSAVFSSFIITMGIIGVLGSVYYLMYQWFASYISFEKIANAERKISASKRTTVSN